MEEGTVTNSQLANKKQVKDLIWHLEERWLRTSTLSSCSLFSLKRNFKIKHPAATTTTTPANLVSSVNNVGLHTKECNWLYLRPAKSA